jgi:hypothetical protein
MSPRNANRFDPGDCHVGTSLRVSSGHFNVKPCTNVGAAVARVLSAAIAPQNALIEHHVGRDWRMWCIILVPVG